MSTTDTEGLHPDDLRRRLPSITTPLSSDTERDERLREAREAATRARTQNPPLGIEKWLITLDAEVTRLDAVVTAVRELHSEAYDFCCECYVRYPCATARALDGGA